MIYGQQDFFSSNLVGRIFFYSSAIIFFYYICAACNFFLPTSACRKFFLKIPHPLPQELNGRLLTGRLIGNLILNENSLVKPCNIRQFSSQLCLVILMPRCETLKCNECNTLCKGACNFPCNSLKYLWQHCCSPVAVIRT